MLYEEYFSFARTSVEVRKPSWASSEWVEKVVVVVHHVPETEESEEGYEAVTMSGVPLGVSVSSDSETAQEALDGLLGALKAFGYVGTVSVEDVTYMGGTQQYELEVS